MADSNPTKKFVQACKASINKSILCASSDKTTILNHLHRQLLKLYDPISAQIMFLLLERPSLSDKLVNSGLCMFWVTFFKSDI